jgi:hypothetical protein
MCFAFFYCDSLKRVFKNYSKDTTLNKLIETCLNNENDAEKLRIHLYNIYSIGDDPKQNPELDGKNGTKECLLLCAKLKIPAISVFPDFTTAFKDFVDQKGRTYSAQPPHPNKPCILVIHCFRSYWEPQMRIIHNGMTFKLLSIMIGSEYCGHQTAVSTCNGNLRYWAYVDSDARRGGVGAMFWKFERGTDKWWVSWKNVLPVTIFRKSSICDFSPFNKTACSVEKRKCSTEKYGTVNCDFVYIYDPNAK